MDFEAFRDSTKSHKKPESLSPVLEALWLEARGDWDGAHQIAQELSGTAGAWLHAYLHRREGDLSNAGYWYGSAGRPFCRSSLDEEWEAIARAFLPAQSP